MGMMAHIEPQRTLRGMQKIDSFLSDSYWGNDIWDIHDPFFDQYPCPYIKRKDKGGNRTRYIRFNEFTELISREYRYYIAHKIMNFELSLQTAIAYKFALDHFARFLRQYCPWDVSLIDLPYEESHEKWIRYLIQEKNLNARTCRVYSAVFAGAYNFFTVFYDDRDEYDKDIWSFRRLPGAHLTKTSHQSALNFTTIPSQFRDVSKRYMKYKATFVSVGTCYHIKKGFDYFFGYLSKANPDWADLKLLKRRHIEDFLSWYINQIGQWTINKITYIMYIKNFLEYIQLADYPESPETLVTRLFLPGDIPQRPRGAKKIRYMPECVLQQLDEHLDELTPTSLIPVIVVLRASGWRAADIMALRYDTCLDKTPQGWYLRGDITKTLINDHRVPITDEIASIVKCAADDARNKSTEQNNPYKLLFPVYKGKRRGLCISGAYVRNALNRLAKRCNITDDAGNLFHFGNHAFRHTKAVELINNGMSLTHLQKWMAHTSPEMTLAYANIFDDTMRKSWEEATKHGLFRMDRSGTMRRIDISEIENEDLIEWEYIRFNLDAVRMPLGYCMKPKKQECHAQLNPCLTCRNLCTTPDFIPQYEVEIQETKVIIERGRAQNRDVWVQKNKVLLERYEIVLAILRKGKTHHLAGKKGREYVGEERAV